MKKSSYPIAVAFVVLLAWVPHAVLASSQHDKCFLDAGNRYNVDPNLLKAIAYVESSLNAKATNSVGDVGLMQINPFWFRKLEPYGITETHLRDPCISANIGAWILAQNFSTYGKSWEAVGRYHAGTKKDAKTVQRAVKYASKVQGIYQRLTKNGAKQ